MREAWKVAFTAFHTDFGDFVIDDSHPYAVLKFPAETFFTMVRTLHKAFEAIAAQPETRTCVLDMSSVTYLDSAAISALLSFDNLLRSRGGWMRVAGGGHNAHLARLFDILGLAKRFPIYESHEAAAAA